MLWVPRTPSPARRPIITNSVEVRISSNFAAKNLEKDGEMKKHLQTRSKTSGYIIRSGGVAVLVLSVLAGFLTPAAQNSAQVRTLSFADRVAYQRAIEEVYWQHRIWPKENAKPKPSFDEVMSAQQIEKKVQD